MKLCWDNIENIRLSKNGNFYNTKTKFTYYLKVCEQCGEEYLGSKKSKFCSKQCVNDNKKDKPCAEETKKKISKSNKGKDVGFKKGSKHKDESIDKIRKSQKGKKKSETHKENISKSKMGNKNPSWKGGYYSKGIPIYDTYAPQLEWIEEVRRNKQDSNILEIRCFKCGKWFVPTLNSVKSRTRHLNGNVNPEYHFYCSQECKNSCIVYGKDPKNAIKEDAVRAGRLTWTKLEREVQKQLREMVLERDEYTCQKCGSLENLKCHHILPVATHPLESADIDNCITLCKNCHDKIHKEVDGCGYRDLRTCIEYGKE